MHRPEIREPTTSDIPEMHRLLTELAEFVDDADAYCRKIDSLERYGFGKHKVFHSLLATMDGTAVGLVNYFPEYSTWRGEPGVYVLDLFISEGQRGGGLGRRMLTETLTRATAGWEAGYIRLSVHGHNTQAIRFYRSLGFQNAVDDCLMIASADPIVSPDHTSLL